VSGPAEEFREFATSRAAPLHRSAYLLCGDWHLAHDLVQETLTKAYRSWRRVAHADNPDAYVRRILINTVRDAAHDRKHHPTVAALPLEHAPEPAIGDESDNVARRAALFQALLTLPFRQRATIVLRYLEGMSERETATALKCSEGTVKSQASRALATLRHHLSREVLTL
jgi:RNA polymerase sigma-70 factor (sigma-E family)